MRRIACLMAGMMLLGGQLFAAGSAKGEAPAIAQKKVLVVYYSRTGNTRKVGNDIARALGADSEELIDRKDRRGAGGFVIAGKDATMGNVTGIEPVQHDPANYDLVVLGTPVWAWAMTPAIRTYIIEHKDAFRRIACFTTSGGTKPGKIVAKMEELSGKKAAATTGFFERDLIEKNRVLYDEKLNAFVGSLK